MNKLTVIALSTMLVLPAAMSFAKDHGDGKMKKCPMCAKMGMMGGEGKGMMGMMNKPSMVPSNDGGVIVLSGKKLYKYDANLALVKEAALKTEEMPMGGSDHSAHH